MKAQAATFLKKAFKIDGEMFDKDIEDFLDGLAERIITVGKWSVKIFIVGTIFMLIFGESRFIDGAPLWWRIAYEWKHLFNDVLYQLFARGTELEGGSWYPAVRWR